MYTAKLCRPSQRKARGRSGERRDRPGKDARCDRVTQRDAGKPDTRPRCERHVVLGYRLVGDETDNGQRACVEDRMRQYEARPQ